MSNQKITESRFMVIRSIKKSNNSCNVKPLIYDDDFERIHVFSFKYVRISVDERLTQHDHTDNIESTVVQD